MTMTVTADNVITNVGALDLPAVTQPRPAPSLWRRIFGRLAREPAPANRAAQTRKGVG